MSPDTVEAAGHCCLHVVVEDVNLEENHILSGMRDADAEGCGDCVAVATFLLGMVEPARFAWFRKNNL